MAKKKSTKTSRPQGSSAAQESNVPVSKQTAGGVTGAVLGAVVAGPIGAIAGGVTGAMMGDASAKGKKPMKRAADAIRSEITEGRVGEAVKKVAGRIKSMRLSKKGGAKKKS